MPNANYQRGAALERLVAERLGQLGYVTIRAAGSRGVADVWAARSALGDKSGLAHLMMVQVKRNGRISDLERMALIATALGAGARSVLAYQVPGRGLVLEDADTREELWQ